MRKIYTIGETVLDILFKDNQPFAARAGGACLNTAVTLGRLGMPVHFISEFGMDQTGNFIDHFLNENNISTDYIYRYRDGKTSIALAFLNDTSDASYEFYKIYPAKRLAVDFPEVFEDDIVLFGSFYALTIEIRPELIKFIRRAKLNNAIVIYDPNFRRQHIHELHKLKPYLSENFSLASLIRGSHEDFSFIFNTTNAGESFNALNDKDKNLLYTNAAEGVFLKTGNLSASFPVKKIKPVSTVGAGDNFNAGIVYSLFKNDIHFNDLRNLDLETWQIIIETAIEFATHVCGSYDNYISADFAKKYML
jgi:fructokinase